jgi:hypothetical protein
MRGRGVNLIPMARQHAKLQRKHLRRWAVCGASYAALLVSACVGARLAWSRDYLANAALLSQSGSRIAELNGTLHRVQQQLAAVQATRHAAQAISDQPDWSILLAILAGSSGDDVVLREVRLNADASSKQDLLLSLRGFGTTQPAVSQFVLRLQDTKLFDEVKLLRTGREPILAASAVTFEISCQIPLNAPAPLASGRSSP